MDNFRKDIVRWSKFVEVFNGVSFIPPIVWSEPDLVFSTDSTLEACGGLTSNSIFSFRFSTLNCLSRFAYPLLGATGSFGGSSHMGPALSWDEDSDILRQ